MDAESRGEEPTSVPISALEHYEYCPRQAALIHVEGFFESNVETVRGDIAHHAVDVVGRTVDRRGQRAWHALPVFSDTHGIHGICDVVEMGPTGPVPVEHKSGQYRPGGPADLQVGAQALCLEEMFHTRVDVAVVFAGRNRKRSDVVIDDRLRARVDGAITGMRALIDTLHVPGPVLDARCRRCSLRPGCLPEGVTTAAEANLFVPRPEGGWDD